MQTYFELMEELKNIKSGKKFTRDELNQRNNLENNIKPSEEPIMQFIDLKQQYERIKDIIHKNIHAVLEHGQYIMGPEIEMLEQQLSAYCGVKHSIGMGSGTDALLVALMALDVAAGDEIIMPPFSFFATAEVVSLLGAKPVFVDIDENTYNIDANKIAAAITTKTKAIIPVSLYGQCADMDAINQIAKQYNLAVIEDAAQSFGAMYKGRKSCALSTIACTSFFPSKPLGGYGDSGACFTDDDQLAEKMRQIRVHGQDRRYHHIRIGINARIDTLQAAILLAKLAIFPEEVETREGIARHYTDLLRNVVKTPQIMPGNTSVYAQYTIEVPDRAALEKHFAKHQVPTAVHYPIPMHLQPVYQSMGYKKGRFPISEHAAEHVLSLPMHPYLKAQEQVRIAELIKEIM